MKIYVILQSICGFTSISEIHSDIEVAHKKMKHLIHQSVDEGFGPARYRIEEHDLIPSNEVTNR